MALVALSPPLFALTPPAISAVTGAKSSSFGCDLGYGDCADACA